MGLKSLISKIDELKELVEGWQRGGEISAVERDLALERVKRIYEQLRFPIEIEVEKVEPKEVEKPAVVVAPEPEPEPEVVVEPEPEPVEPKEVVEIEEQIEIIGFEPEPEPEVVAPTPSEDGERKERRRKILSLYAEEESDSVESVDVPVAEVPVTIERVTERVTTEIVVERAVEETPQIPQAPQTPQAPPPPIPQTSLNDQLGFNDRFLMANDLFHGDFEALGNTLTALDRCVTLNDALIYIAENYSWSGNNDGAKLLYSMLKRRYTTRE